jgi:hypothetical protein
LAACWKHSNEHEVVYTIRCLDDIMVLIVDFIDVNCFVWILCR